MRTLLAGMAAVMVGAAVATVVAAAQNRASASKGPSGTITKEQYAQWKKELSNWGRWGKDDQIGAINLITPAKRKQAAALVKEGFSVSLALDADTVKAIDNPNPYEHRMMGIGADYIGVAPHGWAHTHIDSLAHVNENGVFYNGYKPDPETITKDNGHAKNSIHNLKNGIFTRGILVDMPRLKGVPYLEPGTPIYAEDLEAWEKRTGVKVGSGDALFIRTGVWERRKVVGPWPRGRAGTDAGLDVSVVPWLRQRDVALLGSDHPQGVNPSEIPNAIHDFALVYLGVHLFDNCGLTALAEAAAARKQWQFLLTVAPLPVRGATGTAVNPIATF